MQQACTRPANHKYLILPAPITRSGPSGSQMKRLPSTVHVHNQVLPGYLKYGQSNVNISVSHYTLVSLFLI
jgi:hypothetical protein